uniref:SCP domain-containing protein n=1 Tax=Elaeophora elaphi TaxID=1147741 RepID=A0A0R3RIV3_9BILA
MIMIHLNIAAVVSYKCPGGKLTPQERINIVNQNNKLRSQLIHGKLKNKNGTYMPRGKNMLELTWNCNLEKSAQRWADHCIFGHSSRSEREGIGENVYAYWSSGSVKNLKKTAGTNAGKNWWSELPQKYLNNPSNYLTASVASQGVLHFTQVRNFLFENN